MDPSFDDLHARLAEVHDREVKSLKGEILRLSECLQRCLDGAGLPDRTAAPRPPPPVGYPESSTSLAAEHHSVGARGGCPILPPVNEIASATPPFAQPPDLPLSARFRFREASLQRGGSEMQGQLTTMPRNDAENAPLLEAAEALPGQIPTLARATSDQPSRTVSHDVPTSVPSSGGLVRPTSASSARRGASSKIGVQSWPSEDQARTSGTGPKLALFQEHVPNHWRSLFKPLDSAGLRIRNELVQARDSEARRRLLRKEAAEAVVAALLVLNALYVGWQVQVRALGRDSSAVSAVGFIICVIFTVELLYRLHRDGWQFVNGPDRYWHILDTVVVVCMILDEVQRLAQVGGSSFFSQLSIVRTVRLLRLTRILHVLRVLAIFRDFRTLIDTVCRSCSALVCVTLVVVSTEYVIAIVLTQGALEHCRDHPSDDVCLYFGTLDAAMLSLYEAVFGGILWGELLEALQVLHVAYPSIFIAFVSFVLVILLNIVTSLVIELETEVSRKERQATKVKEEIREKKETFLKFDMLFQELDMNKSGDISRADFQHALEDPGIEGLLASMELDVHDASTVFELLDRDRTGVVQRSEFVLGCLRLRGEARTVDVVKLHADSREIIHNLLCLKSSLDDIMGRSERGKPQLPASPRDEVRSDAEVMSAASQASLERAPSTAVGPVPLMRVGQACSIPKTEERAMSLKEFQALRREITKRCPLERWTDATGKPLAPADVNLYHLNNFHICPLTAPSGVILKGVKAECAPGSVVSQSRGNHYAEGVVQQFVEGGDLHVMVTYGRFVAADTGHSLPLLLHGDIDCGVPRRVITPGALSYKELVSFGPLKPRWFCCHWWGETVFDFVKCCEAHSKLREVRPDEASFWCCAYANCQHDLSSDITDDPESSSFRRAMGLAEGVLLVLDDRATPFRRIWCDFELYKTIQVDKKQLDIVTVREGKTHLLSKDCLPNETPYYKNLRESEFPSDILVEGMRRNLEEGDASVYNDKVRILESMARDVPGVQGHDAALAEALRRANGALHGYFALAAWPNAIRRGNVQDFDLGNPGSLSLPSVLACDGERHRVELSLAHSHHVHDEDVQVLAAGLPQDLRELRLILDGCPNITDAGIRLLAEHLPQGLKVCSLDFSNCLEVTDKGLETLAQGLPRGLQELNLYFTRCSDISETGAEALATHMPTGLKKLSVSLNGTKLDRKFESVDALQRAVSKKWRIFKAPPTPGGRRPSLR